MSKDDPKTQIAFPLPKFSTYIKDHPPTSSTSNQYPVFPSIFSQSPFESPLPFPFPLSLVQYWLYVCRARTRLLKVRGKAKAPSMDMPTISGVDIVGWDLGEEEEEEVVKVIKEDVEEEEEEINDEKVRGVVMGVQ